MAAKYFSWTFPFCYKSFVTGHHACSPTPSQISIDILLQQQKMFDKNYRRLLIKMIYNIFLLLMVGWCILNGWTLYPISPCQPLHAVGYPFDCPNNVCLIKAGYKSAGDCYILTSVSYGTQLSLFTIKFFRFNIKF